MPRIHAHTMRVENITTQTVDAAGNPTTVEQPTNVVHSVTFDDYAGTPHTLTFYPKGTQFNVPGNDDPLIVGEHMIHYVFTAAEEAVDAYLSGKL